MRYIPKILVLLFVFAFHTLSAQTISGVLSVCAGSYTTLSGSPAGGVWSSSSTTVASVTSTGGMVTGNIVGTAVISYATGTGTATATVTVNPQPGPISGPSVFCVGSSATLSSTIIGGTWASSNAAILNINPGSGLASGAATGTALITYTTGAGCTVYSNNTVQAAVAAITGPATVCAGATITMANAAPGGSWSSSNTSVATIGSASGVALGVGSGTTCVSYSLSGGCYATRIVTVDLTVSPITGPSAICTGASSTMYNASPGGTWTISGSSASISGAGLVTALSPGTATVSYTLPSGCMATAALTVQAAPAAIAGISNLCLGSSTLFSNSVSGGTWSSSNVAICTVGSSSGMVNAGAAGSAIITYTTNGPAGCYATFPVTVSVGPSPVSGPSSVCTGANITLSSATGGGTWISSAPGIATVGASTGVVSGVNSGTVTISYTISSATCVVTKQVTVNASPAPITGTTSICLGNATSLTSATAGGVWSSSLSAVGTVSTTGNVSSISAGTTIVAYTLASGCYDTAIVTVNVVPGPIAGPTAVCQGSVIVLTNPMAGGTWSSADATIVSVLTIGSPGSVVGISAGVAIITYTMPTGCLTTSAVLVNPQPVVNATAALSACGPTYLGVATGGDSYVWAPATGLSCASCATTVIDVTATTTYTVTATNLAGCENSTMLTVNGDRILGHISFSGAMPSSPNVGVWLMRYNPADSALIAVDSTTTCLDGGMPYFEFATKPAGYYHLRTKLLSALPGYSGYIPTYSDAEAHWWQAASFHHNAATDTQHVTMAYASTPSGSGLIRGTIRTYTAPAVGQLVFLKDASTGQIVCHTFTDVNGRYTFTNLAYGSYFVYPEEYHYYTTTGAAITLSTTNGQDTLGFRKDSVTRRIYPFSFPVATSHVAAGHTRLFPNPASGAVFIQPDVAGAEALLVLKDVAGREVFHTSWTTSAATHEVSLPQLADGIYVVQLRVGDAITNTKLQVQHH